MTDNRYTCPILMYIQSLIKPKHFWRYSSSYGWVLMELPTVQARPIFSERLIRLECKFWNSRIGIRLKLWCGTKQREQRVKMVNEIDELREQKDVFSNLQTIG